MDDVPSPLRVVVAGGGVAAWELVLGLNALAGKRVAITLIAPDSHFTYRQPKFGNKALSQSPMQRVRLDALAGDLGARLVRDTVCGVVPDRHEVMTASGTTHRYDELVVAVGARPYAPFRDAVTVGGQDTGQALADLSSRLGAGRVRSVAFVVPTGASWTLPLYELAVMTARQGWSAGLDDPRYWLVTPEPQPLAVFGAAVSREIHQLLEPEGITFMGGARPDVRAGVVLLDRRTTRLEVDLVVCLPLLAGPGIWGLPTDVDGFIPADRTGRVPGAADVYAAGDATSFPIKQGGLACQQADAVAETISAAAGAAIRPLPFRPVLRGKIITGGRDRFLFTDSPNEKQRGEFSEQPLWWPPTKVVGRHLSGYLLGRDEDAVHDSTGSAPHVSVDLLFDGEG
jgi:sulfide:quinone oxidoreductase